MKSYKCRVNMTNFKYFLNFRPQKFIFEAYDRKELILLSYALLSEYCSLKKSLDISDN